MKLRIINNCIIKTHIEREGGVWNNLKGVEMF